MILRRVSQADLPLTLAEAKAQCRISPDVVDFDADLARLIEAATGKVSAMSGLVLAVETWELRVQSPSGPVALPVTPVVRLVSINGDADVSAFSLDVAGDCATVTGPWPAGEVAIVFEAGGNVPAQLTLAIRMLVATWFRDREATGDPVIEVPYAVESLVSDHRRGWVMA